MDQAVSDATRLQHVVFPDSVGGFGRTFHRAARPPVDPADAAARPLLSESESFLRWLLGRAGLRFRHYKPGSLDRRLPACLRALRVSSTDQARVAVRRNPHLAWRALDALLIGVTGFFRDEHVFATLRDRTLPDLLARWASDSSSSAPRPFRVWSAGCSDGSELYSVAMLLVELGGLAPGAVELLGTDCRPDALERAAEGAYDAASMKGVSPALLRRYFSFDGERHRLQRALRAAAHWRLADVLAGPEPGPWDLVLCRNLAIYLEPAPAAALWAALARVLRPGGALVLGKAERPLGVAGLALESPCVYRRTVTDSEAGT